MREVNPTCGSLSRGRFRGRAVRAFRFAALLALAGDPDPCICAGDR